MKIKFKLASCWIIGLAVLAVSACSVTMKVDSFAIKGSVIGISDQKIYLKQVVKGERKAQEFLTAEIVDGKFEFEGKIANPPVMLKVEFEQPTYLIRESILADNSSMSLAISVKETRNKYSILDLDVEGSSSHDEYVKYKDGLKKFTVRRGEVSEEIRALGVDFKLPVEEWAPGDAEKVDALKSKRKQVGVDHIEYIKQLAKTGDSQLTVLLALQDLMRARPNPFSGEEERSALFAGLSGTLQTSGLGEVYSTKLAAKLEQQRLAAEVSVGNTFKDFTQNDVDGNPVKASDLLKQGRYLFLDFWASWCGPCRAENPHVLEAYNKYHDMGFDVLAISLDREKDDWLEAIDEDGMPWMQVSDLKGWDNVVSKMYGVNGIPKNFLLNEKGEIVATGLRGKKLLDKLAELLDK